LISNCTNVFDRDYTTINCSVSRAFSAYTNTPEANEKIEGIRLMKSLPNYP